jgi:hypothetical protein
MSGAIEPGGDEEPPSPLTLTQVATMALTSDDEFLVLASDGIFDVFENDQVRTTPNPSPTPAPLPTPTPRTLTPAYALNEPPPPCLPYPSLTLCTRSSTSPITPRPPPALPLPPAMTSPSLPP